MARRPPKKQVPRKATKEERTKKMMSYLLVILMVVSMAGIFLSSTSNNQNTSFSYGDYDFDLIQDPATDQYYFQTEINNTLIPFYSLPDDAAKLSATEGLADLINSADVIVFSTKGNASYASIFDEIRFGLDVYAGKSTIPATLGPVEGSTQLVLSCANATTSQAVIEVLIGEKTELVSTDYGCAQVTLREIDLPLFRDRILYTALGILD